MSAFLVYVSGVVVIAATAVEFILLLLVLIAVSAVILVLALRVAAGFNAEIEAAMQERMQGKNPQISTPESIRCTFPTSISAQLAQRPCLSFDIGDDTVYVFAIRVGQAFVVKALVSGLPHYLEDPFIDLNLYAYRSGLVGRYLSRRRHACQVCVGVDEQPTGTGMPAAHCHLDSWLSRSVKLDGLLSVFHIVCHDGYVEFCGMRHADKVGDYLLFAERVGELVRVIRRNE